MTLSLAWSVPWAPLTIRQFTTLQSDPGDLWPLRHLIRVMRRHDLTKKDLPSYQPTYLPTTLQNTLQELVCQWHFHFSCIWAVVLFYTFDKYRRNCPWSNRFLSIIFDPHFWPSLLTLTFDPHFWPSFLTLIFGPHFWPSFLTHIFYPYFWPSFFILISHPHFSPSFLTIGKTVLETWHLRHWLHYFS